jgi:hypothetical protein
MLKVIIWGCCFLRTRDEFPFQMRVALILKKAVADDTHSAQRIPHYFTHPLFLALPLLLLSRLRRAEAVKAKVCAWCLKIKNCLRAGW